MTGWMAETLAAILLALSLGAAVLRPRNLNEAVVAVPAALIAIATGLISFKAARHESGLLWPTAAFLAAILVFGHLCAEAGVFEYLAAVGSRAAHGDPRRLLLVVITLASLVTVTLTLDATVVLLTPVVLAGVQALRMNARPHLMACVQLANAGSLLLPVSNLTNLLVFAATGATFVHFTALMALPWLAMLGLQWAQLRWFFAADLTPEQSVTDHDESDSAELNVPQAPQYALAVLTLTLIGFVVASAVGVAPAWVALAGVVLLAPGQLRAKNTTPMEIARSANIGFCVFLLAVAVVVSALSRHGLDRVLTRLLPTTNGLLGLLAVAVVAAVLADIANNLPATLVLLPLLADRPAALLALLIGVNVGPNLTYAGSLATLLWRRQLPPEDRPSSARFHLYGAVGVPVGLVTATVLLWLSVQVVGA